MSFVNMSEGNEKETALEYARQQAFEAMQGFSQEIINKYSGPKTVTSQITIRDIERQLSAFYDKVINKTLQGIPLSPEEKEELKRIQEQFFRIKGRDKMAVNWFKKMIMSQTVLDGTIHQVDPEIVKGPKEAVPHYQEGVRVRDRRRGMANPQDYGLVDKIDGSKIRIVWNPEDKDRKIEEVFDMIEDTEVLSLIVAEV